MNRERRVATLEQLKKAHGAVVLPLIAAELGESSGCAVAGYIANSSPLLEVDNGDVNIIVLVPVAPMRWAA